MLTDTTDALLCAGCLNESWCLYCLCSRKGCVSAICSPSCEARLQPYHAFECGQLPCLQATPSWFLALRLVLRQIQEPYQPPHDPDLSQPVSAASQLAAVATLEPATSALLPPSLDIDRLVRLLADHGERLALLVPGDLDLAARVATVLCQAHARVEGNSFAIQRLTTHADASTRIEMIEQSVIGKAIYSHSSMVNHSCCPNAIAMYVLGLSVQPRD